MREYVLESLIGPLIETECDCLLNNRIKISFIIGPALPVRKMIETPANAAVVL